MRKQRMWLPKKNHELEIKTEEDWAKKRWGEQIIWIIPALLIVWYDQLSQESLTDGLWYKAA